MKKHKLLKIALVLTVVATVVFSGTALAYMFRKTEQKNNEFVVTNVSCLVHESTNANVSEKTSIKVQNTGNTDAYLRVRFVSYWVKTMEDGSTAIVSKPSEMPEINLAQGWIEGKDNTYYYKEEISPNELTEELLSSKMYLSKEEEYLQVVEVFAEAIQSKPGKAVENSWKVTLDENGEISAVN